MRFRFLVVVVDADVQRERDACMLPDRVLNCMAEAVRTAQPEDYDLDLQVVSVKQLEDE
jgi:hypothetical protein